ncbi:hypothetical protein D9M71_599710 [compost metagenome]
MHQARHEGLRTALFKPATDDLDLAQRRRTGPTFEFPVAVQQAFPARNLTFQKTVEPA